MPWKSLLDFWFGELTDGLAAENKRANWFASDKTFDDQCRQFEALLQDAQDGVLKPWLENPEGRLAYILLCDQIPRNIFRGTAQAFAYDAFALAAARAGVEQGSDLSLAWEHRSFFYMPFEHSESYLDQHAAVGLFSRLRDDVPKELRSVFGNSLRFAQQHRDIILKFGRFPHRNGVLNRTSTEAETTFVSQGDGFGQVAR